jgi:hypothetical protein
MTLLDHAVLVVPEKLLRDAVVHFRNSSKTASIALIPLVHSNQSQTQIQLINRCKRAQQQITTYPKHKTSCNC